MGRSSRLPAGPSPARPSHNIAAIHTAAASKRQREPGENKGVKVAPRCVQKGQRVFGCVFPLPRPGGIQARPTAADAAGRE